MHLLAGVEELRGLDDANTVVLEVRHEVGEEVGTGDGVGVEDHNEIALAVLVRELRTPAVLRECTGELN
jgi:hypothetical protein